VRETEKVVQNKTWPFRICSWVPPGYT